jgi:hypothetical protein
VRRQSFLTKFLRRMIQNSIDSTIYAMWVTQKLAREPDGNKTGARE